MATSTDKQQRRDDKRQPGPLTWDGSEGEQYQPQNKGEPMHHQNDLSSALGAPLGGGFYAGRVMIDGIPYALIVAPRAEGEHEGISWLDSEDRVNGADSYNDGAANTKAMANAGSELAQWALSLNINGFTDWHIPSQDELEVLYRNLKPTNRKNSLYGRSGVNASAVPSTQAYSADPPGQTVAPDFAEGGEQAFADGWYWSSTQHASHDACAWLQDFDYGGQHYDYESAELRARAVRRFAI